MCTIFFLSYVFSSFYFLWAPSICSSLVSFQAVGAIFVLSLASRCHLSFTLFPGGYHLPTLPLHHPSQWASSSVSLCRAPEHQCLPAASFYTILVSPFLCLVPQVLQLVVLHPPSGCSLIIWLWWPRRFVFFVSHGIVSAKESSWQVNTPRALCRQLTKTHSSLSVKET